MIYFKIICAMLCYIIISKNVLGLSNERFIPNTDSLSSNDMSAGSKTVDRIQNDYPNPPDISKRRKFKKDRFASGASGGSGGDTTPTATQTTTSESNPTTTTSFMESESDSSLLSITIYTGGIIFGIVAGVALVHRLCYSRSTRRRANTSDPWPRRANGDDDARVPIMHRDVEDWEDDNWEDWSDPHHSTSATTSSQQLHPSIEMRVAPSSVNKRSINKNVKGSTESTRKRKSTSKANSEFETEKSDDLFASLGMGVNYKPPSKINSNNVFGSNAVLIPTKKVNSSNTSSTKRSSLLLDDDSLDVGDGGWADDLDLVI